METSDHYIVVEKMIQRKELSSSELQHLLNSLEEQGRIAPEESQSLMELAQRLDRDQATP